MKKIAIVASLFLTAIFFDTYADITINFPSDFKADSIFLYHAPIIKLANAKDSSERGLVEETIPIIGGKVTLRIDTVTGGSRYGIPVTKRDFIDVFASPEDKITVDINSISPFDYTISGTPLLECMNEVKEISMKFDERRKSLTTGDLESKEEMIAIENDYFNDLKNYIERNISNPDVGYAVMTLHGKDFIIEYEHLPENAKNSIIFPILNAKFEGVKKMLAQESGQKNLSSGNFVAPKFMLKNLNGSDVSLSDFKGKWIILDFWGSWCPWCIKGFPELKEIYSKYKDKVEIIGIDCNESEEAWKEGVAKYDLPWVNVYCPSGNPILEEYYIQGYPTKVVIDPEGIIKDIITGHTPDFKEKIVSYIE